MFKKRGCLREVYVKETKLSKGGVNRRNMYVEGSKLKKRVCRRSVYVEEVCMLKGGLVSPRNMYVKGRCMSKKYECSREV